MKKLMIITMFLIFGIWSCGTRKTNKSEEKIEVAKRDTTNIGINTGKVSNKSELENIKNKENASWNFDQGTLTPINPEKPMTHTDPDGKTNTYTNANVNFGSGSGTSIKEFQTNKETKTAIKDTSSTKINSGSSEDIKSIIIKKETDRQGVGTSIWIWVGVSISICIVFAFIWFLISRRKKKLEE